ncbi:phospholipid carrier-dependent glycosyltransferase [Actinomadura graeca]|uniref:Phospholipid carrier-dependent glycosyltransferase n=1 Tax=Actinomadura graeca TaxID=2750812 RepID=A0ABX8R7H0_9ACTN|nr:phospholipid carrier-dependent glycosyltransferase [Actinomadura graeca]QXJ24923.1 phospholipid carrier-dependent glycosyltransferase [Actinomadura graeca]
MPSRLFAAFAAIWGFRPVLRHGPFLVALAGGAHLRWTAVRAYPHGLWFTGDSYFYLGYALHPTPPASKTLGYSLMLRLMEPLHSLTAVVVVQHVMGLAIAAMAYAVLCRARLPAWAAAIVTLPVLFDAYQIELEHLLMSEALFTFLIAAALTLLLWHTGGGCPGPAWWAALPAGLLLGYAVLVRSAGAPLIPVILLLLLLYRPGGPPRLLPRLLPRSRPALLPVSAFGALAAVPLVAYALWFHAERGTYALTTSDGIYLWGRTAGFADCAKIRPPADEQGLCLDAASRAEKDPPGHLIWRADIPPRQRFSSVVSPEANATLRSFSVHAILAQPGDYLRAVGEGIGMAFGTGRHPHPTAATEGLYHFPDRPQLFPGGRSWTGGGTALADAMRYGRTDEPSRVVQPYADRMIGYQGRYGLPGPALAAAFAAGGAGVLLARRRRREVLLAWGTAVTLLVFPIASADFDYRYVVPPMPFACLAAGLALSALRARGDGPGRGVPDAEEEDEEKSVSRWWGSRGSRRRDSDPATVP